MATVTHFGAVRLEENRIQTGVSQRVRFLKTKRNLRNQLFRTVDKLLLYNNYDSICIFIGCCKRSITKGQMRMCYSHLTHPPTYPPPTHQLTTHPPIHQPPTHHLPTTYPPHLPSPATYPHPPTHPPFNNHRIGNVSGVARASCFKGLLPSSTQSKQWRIELLYWYKRAKTSRTFTLGGARQSI